MSTRGQIGDVVRVNDVGVNFSYIGKYGFIESYNANLLWARIKLDGEGKENEVACLHWDQVKIIENVEEKQQICMGITFRYFYFNLLDKRYFEYSVKEGFKPYEHKIGDIVNIDYANLETCLHDMELMGIVEKVNKEYCWVRIFDQERNINEIPGLPRRTEFEHQVLTVKKKYVSRADNQQYWKGKIVYQDTYMNLLLDTE